MTDNPQQREFEAEWDRHNTAIEPHEMIRYGMVKAIAFRYWQAALSQPKVAGAVDERFPPREARNFPEDASHENGNYSNTCYLCGREFTGHKRRITCKACETARTASPSQPAAGEKPFGYVAEKWDKDNEVLCVVAKRTEYYSVPVYRRASPADDGEVTTSYAQNLAADAFTRGVAAGMKMAREIDDKMDNLLSQQDKQP